MSIRPVKMQNQARPHIEGAGVRIRVFGFGETEQNDPFLMMDDFRNDDPENAMKRAFHGIRIGALRPCYVLKGNVEHGDSLGNRGVLSDGDVQWMTAGSGIIHRENAVATLKARCTVFSSGPICRAIRK